MSGEKQTQWFLTFNRCRHHQLSSLTRELSWISLPYAVKLGNALLLVSTLPFVRS